MTREPALTTVRSHRDLVVWQKSLELVDHVYDLAESFPRDELFGLTHQIKRAVVSIPANIAEGQARASARDFAHFLVIAKGSLVETDTLLTVAVRRKYADPKSVESAFSLMIEISKMLTALRSRIRASSRKG